MAVRRIPRADREAQTLRSEAFERHDRAVVLDRDDTVLYTQLVPEIAEEPDYDKALAALD